MSSDNSILLNRVSTRNTLREIVESNYSDAYAIAIRRLLLTLQVRITMYFPYLRGRQFELIAIRELIEKSLLSKNAMPVVEPVKLSSALI